MPILSDGSQKLKGATEEPLKISDKAIGFRRLAQDGNEVALSDFTGKPVILIGVGDIRNPIAKEFLNKLKPVISEAKANGVQTIVSTTSYYKTNKEIADANGFDFPLLDDESFYEISGTYGQQMWRGETLIGIEFPIYILDAKHTIVSMVSTNTLVDFEITPELTAAIDRVSTKVQA
ncbi:redoxin domain-containing protein [Gloeocapsopsis sp. IPPAS B-1203]|uniref:peroxiredoxin family protein n=1 Tax=Gloeocapsopsis sp. IPPAS B-1203 TaxID=2049454 RepID=UPI000C1928C0|nr:redoxin domain-containing protein [Gloeocapsopsis sp. IPPAS B-1203]PIG90819.1 hypothetical protein CSQ79_24540 [Gloeocapsopsis sp. IPPAS B-1203]